MRSWSLPQILVALMIAWCPVWTAIRLPAWQSEAALWTAALAVDPTPRAWENLGVAQVANHDVNAAIRSFRTAIVLTNNPRLSLSDRINARTIATMNLAFLAYGHGECAAAMQGFLDTVEWAHLAEQRVFTLEQGRPGGGVRILGSELFGQDPRDQVVIGGGLIVIPDRPLEQHPLAESPCLAH